MMNDVSSLQTTFTDTVVCRLREAIAKLETLRRQPLDSKVLERVQWAERETKRWTRTARTLQRKPIGVGLMEDPGLVVKRVLNEVREEWKGTGLEIEAPFRKLSPRCFDQRTYIEVLHAMVDFLLSTMHSPKRIRGSIGVNTRDEVFVEIDVHGEVNNVAEGETELVDHIVNRAGGSLLLKIDEEHANAVVEFNSPTQNDMRHYIFPLETADVA